MTYIVKVYKWKDAKKILKGWDNGKPVFISQGEYNKGKTSVQEFNTPSRALVEVKKIQAVEEWRHYEVVGLA